MNGGYGAHPARTLRALEPTPPGITCWARANSSPDRSFAGSISLLPSESYRRRPLSDQRPEPEPLHRQVRHAQPRVQRVLDRLSQEIAADDDERHGDPR